MTIHLRQSLTQSNLRIGDGIETTIPTTQNVGKAGHGVPGLL